MFSEIKLLNVKKYQHVLFELGIFEYIFIYSFGLSRVNGVIKIFNSSAKGLQTGLLIITSIEKLKNPIPYEAPAREIIICDRRRQGPKIYLAFLA